ncbi:hypothetical protein IDH10_04160 [Pelagibacterales bacterium SAG-MED20]|nr:hypothetical protein [Pelagibacterales bacterium SAG-MED20]
MFRSLNSKKIILILIPILSLFFGFLLQEDLSTGGAKIDFTRTFPAVTDFSNFIFNTTHQYTRHFPLHYLILSIPHLIFNDIFFTKLFYLFFSLLLPFLVYLNISKLYPDYRSNCFLIAVSLLFLPFYRASSIWPNVHLTALIFLLSAHYFYMTSLSSKKFIYKFLNIFFLSLATYSVQSYVVFFMYYLFYYYRNESIKVIFLLLIFCMIFSLPGFYILLTTNIGPRLNFTSNLSYTVITNFSIVFFCFSFFLFNKNNLIQIKNIFFKLSRYEIILLISFFLLLSITYENHHLYGGGFFYKVSNVVFENKYFFYLTGFLGITIFYIFYKVDKNIFFMILLTNFSAIAYFTSQKYFEPILIVIILVLNKNILSKNIITNVFNTLIFYYLTMGYFIVALINKNYGFSKSLVFGS